MAADSTVDIKTLRSRAGAGDALAQTALAYAMLAERGGPTEAVHLLNTAAAQGHADAFHLLAALAVMGIGRPRCWPPRLRQGAVAQARASRATR